MTTHSTTPSVSLSREPQPPRLGQDVYVFRASFAQSRMWLLHQLEPTSPRYNISEAFRARGPLDVGALECVLAKLVQRHESLRTSFGSQEGQPVQVIATEVPIAFPVIDLTGLPPRQAEETARVRMAEEAHAPFDLAAPPLWRVQVLHLAEQDHLVQFTLHHLITDGWSMDVFYRELAAFYEAVAQETSPWLPPLPIQYADYAEFQREALQGEAREQQLAYWRGQLASAPALLQLPTDRPRPAEPTYRGASYSFAVPPSLRERLAALSQSEGVTLFMALEAAFAALLSRYTEQEDILVGTPVANRALPETEGLIGLFVNTLVLRCSLTGDPSFRTLLARVRRTCLDAYDHQDLPFEQVVEALQPERSLRHHALFQVMFVLQSAQLAGQRLAGVDLSPVDLPPGGAITDLLLEMTETPRGLGGQLTYSTDLFEEATVARLASHLLNLLDAAVSDPDRPIWQLALLSPSERELQVQVWNATGTDYPREACVHHLFEAQAERTPEGLAVIWGGEQLTYRELNRRASQLAHALQAIGVGPEVCVGVCLERSADLIVSQLAVLKAGGAYVPLDPAYPGPRLAYLLEDTGARVLLTCERSREDVPARAGTRVVSLDSGWQDIARESGENPTSPATSESLCYVMYTSGSTGSPKGVCIPHRAVNRLVCCTNYVAFAPGDRVAHASNACFDASTLEVWGPLLHGASIVILSHECVLSPHEFARTLREEGITIAFTTTALFNLMAATLPSAFAGLRDLFFGGEAADPEAVRAVLAAGPPQRLFNVYGPTESTTFATTFEVRDEPQGEQPIPIGRPIANTEVYLLDGHGQLVPIGAAGELYIGGDGLARGYLNRPDQTSERFVSHPFAQGPGARLYKTGDLARYLPDGTIVFLGRRDRQIKLRGFRIELEEIEAVLRQHPQVRESLVVARNEANGGPRLVAYVLPRKTSRGDGGDLRAFAAERLPHYMLPAAFVWLNAWPLSPVGKVDYRALPAPDWQRPALPGHQDPPRTEMERLLAALWCELLAVSHVGMNDDFFELGGHSLLAAQLTARLSAHLDRPLSVKLLFRHPTLARLAAELEQLRAGWGEEGAPPAAQPEPARAACPGGRDLARVDRARGGETPLAAAPFTLLEPRSLSGLIAEGLMAPVEAAALGYLLETEFAGASHEAVLRDLFEGQPVLTDVLETAWGRTALFILPLYASTLYTEEGRLIELCIQALRMAKLAGARVASLTGLLPSATGYGEILLEALGGRGDVPAITTGHATTCASVVLAIKRILAESNRDLSRERVGFLGLGSVGLATLRLMLAALPHPQELLLCDLYSRHDALGRARAEVEGGFGFHGAVRLLEADAAALPASFYEATLVVGATNVPDVLDVGRVKPGTLLVDDSGPHCFDARRAIARFEARGDILFTEGGALAAAQPITQVSYLPPAWAQVAGDVERTRLGCRDPHEIMGCVFSGVLSARFADLTPTVGLVDAETGKQHYTRLAALGLEAAPLACDGYRLAADRIGAFRRSFGGEPGEGRGERGRHHGSR